MRRRYYKKNSLWNLIVALVVFALLYGFVSVQISKQQGITTSFLTIPLFSELNVNWIFVLIIILLCVLISFKLYDYNRLKKAGIAEIDMMTGFQFEEKLTILFFQLGYTVKHTGRTGDFGVDLVIEKNGIKTAVQAKCYGLKNNVPESAIQQAFAGATYYECSKALVVTNRFYTTSAYQLAKKIHVDLWDRNELVNNLVQANKITND